VPDTANWQCSLSQLLGEVADGLKLRPGVPLAEVAVASKSPLTDSFSPLRSSHRVRVTAVVTASAFKFKLPMYSTRISEPATGNLNGHCPIKDSESGILRRSLSNLREQLAAPPTADTSSVSTSLRSAGRLRSTVPDRCLFEGTAHARPQLFSCGRGTRAPSQWPSQSTRLQSASQTCFGDRRLVGPIIYAIRKHGRRRPARRYQSCVCAASSGGCD